MIPRCNGHRFAVGDTVYMAHPDEVARGVIVAEGDDGRNYKPGYRPAAPVVVLVNLGSERGERVVWGRAELYGSPAAAAIASAEKARLAAE